MRLCIALIALVVSTPAFAVDTTTVGSVNLVVDVPKAETCADSPPDVPGVSVCLEQGQPAPFRARALSFAEHQRRERIDTRNADLWDGITKGDVVVVSKPAFYVVIAGGAAAVVTSIVLGALAASHKL